MVGYGEFAKGVNVSELSQALQDDRQTRCSNHSFLIPEECTFPRNGLKSRNFTRKMLIVVD